MAAAGSSRFAVTCGLMRKYMREQQEQYMREQQQKGVALLPPALSLSLPAEAAEETDGRTMQLFPTRAAGMSPPPPPKERPEEQTTAPLTIFYDGRLLVFEDFPADKAKALMQLAGSDSSPAEKVVAPAEAPKPAAPQPGMLPDMPIARKVSLQRFLQKRKHRIISAGDPYHKPPTASPAEKDAKPAKDEDYGAWLGL